MASICPICGRVRSLVGGMCTDCYDELVEDQIQYYLEIEVRVRYEKEKARLDKERYGWIKQ